MTLGSRPRRLHIGHHFFGSGNIGDDFMLAGFLDVARAMPGAVELTCCTPFDRESQRLRLPDVQWLPYDSTAREQSIAGCDAWVGVGDSPFQSEVGSWFLDHLSEEVEWCRRHRKPMFYFCVGVNDYGAMDYPVTRTIVHASDHIWTRDPQSAELISRIIPSSRVTASADLANVFFAARRWRQIEPGVIGFLLNFEDRAAFEPDALAAAIDATSSYAHRWLVQEVRTLDGSEWQLLDRLPAAYRDRLEVRAPSYTSDSLTNLAECWGVPQVVVTSRYHGALLSAWAGARVVVVERNAKLAGLVSQLGLTSVSDLRSHEPLVAAIREAKASDARRLERFASVVEDSARAFAALAL
jgi:polysaccharide pyruvyl transferase WcaK-like protein